VISITVPAMVKMNYAMVGDQGTYSQIPEITSSVTFKYVVLFLSCLWSFGSYPDEFESTRIIGERQFRKALELFGKATEPLIGKVDYRHTYLDFSNLEVSLPKARGGHEVVKTCPAALGFSFAAGTTDGPGAFDFKQGDDEV
jgi:hypothetical protein